ncbi:hypothetical protein NIA71_19360 [Ihubacter massiliensis]|uniref:Transposase DDE domain-containing protein n=1 Tax=Hominibacterium faecale TaxID=2839743 RepID=A0A9J6QNX5_9FIRM|nr:MULTISPECIES: hypothetical protein [Eubacteriales Family XIII. Incertae Sedis]MCO7124080.1 hypothetical protein [Ihubacter massiliensis]MCU7379072.1 hypothetical protein [Hominibacterium faecale]
METVIGGRAYGEEENLSYCNETGTQNVSKLSLAVTHRKRKTRENFSNNKDAEMYVCKAGYMAIEKKYQKASKHNNYSAVDTCFFDVEKCKRYPFKES